MQFKLPDLGEGLQEAEIIEWLVKEGDQVEVDQLMLLVETAKAVVEIPSPVKSVISKLCEPAGSVIKVGEVLFEYGTDTITDEGSAIEIKEKSVSVVGELESRAITNTNESFIIGSEEKYKEVKLSNKRQEVVSPSVIAFAKKLGLELELIALPKSEASYHRLVEIFEAKNKRPEHEKEPFFNCGSLGNKLVKLSGAKKVMAQTMSKSCQQVPAVTLFDDANVTAWYGTEDITLRLLEA